MRTPIHVLPAETFSCQAITPLGERPYRIAAALAALLVLLTVAF